MDPNAWQELPETPPNPPRASSEAPTLVLERTAAGDPPPALSPHRDSNWWRAGSAVLLVALLGLAAWLLSEGLGARSGDEAAAAPPEAATTAPQDTAPQPQGTDAVPAEPVEPPSERNFRFFSGSAELPPELEQFLNENGIELFGPEGLVPRFEEFFGPDGPFPDGVPPRFEEFFGPGGPFGTDSPFGPKPNLDEFFRERGSDSFGFNYSGELPEQFKELLRMLPQALLGEANRTEVESLVEDLLADPDLPAELKQFVERLADRIGIANKS